MNPILEKLNQFKRSLYLNLLIGSSSLSLSLLLSFFIIISLCEYFFWFSTTIRALLFYSYLLIFSILFGVWVVIPFLRVFVSSLQLSNDKAATYIGKKVSSVGDKLLNTLQLLQNPNELAKASVEKNSSLLMEIPFDVAIEKKRNYRYARLLLAPLLILLMVFSCDKSIILGSAQRIYNHNRVFSKPLPYNVLLLTKNLNVVENNDLELKFLITGSEIPAFFDFSSNDARSTKLYTETDTLAYTLKSVTKDTEFKLTSVDFESETYKVKVLRNPKVLGLVSRLNYPAHTGLKNDVFVNTYSYTIPYGTEINLKINTQDVDSIHILNVENYKKISRSLNQYEITFRARASSQMLISLYNSNISTPSSMALDISVENDQSPAISLTYIYDSLNSNLSFYGKISDDYGFRSLQFKYKIEDNNLVIKNLPIQEKQTQQSYYGNHNFADELLNTKKARSIEFYTEVVDNDIFNPKASKSAIYKIVILSESEIKKEISKQSESAKDAFEDVKDESRNIQKELSELQKKLLQNRKLEWNDIKKLEDLKKEHNKIEDKLKEIDKNLKQLNESQKKINDIKDEKLLEKMQQLQKLMDELLDDKTKELYEQLQQMYEQKLDPEEIQKLMEKIKDKTSDLEKEINKALEYFKKLDFEIKTKELANELDKLADLQDSVSKEQFESKKMMPQEKLEQQEQINQQLNDALNKLDSLEEDSKQLENPVDMEEEKQLSEELEKESQDLENQMKQQDSKPSNKEKMENKKMQENLSKKMRQLSKSLENNMQGAEKEQLEEDMASLTRTLENLIRLSYEQEDVMLGLKKIRSIDPTYNKLSQQQLKIKGDFEIIKDSMEALATRVIQIKPFVSEEVRLINEKVESSLNHLKNKRISIATNEQQSAMTSMNNLAVLLSDILEQMQNESDSQQGSSKGKKKKQNKKSSLSELQQSLNQQLENLKKSGKSGRELSEELRKLAVQQEMIRQMMREKGEKPGKSKEEPGKDGKGGDKMDKLMQESKNDMINKKVTEQLINRQKEILTRLLESEKAERERGMKEEREAERPKNDYEEQKNLLLEQYLKEKERQVEEIQKKSPVFMPFYRKNIEKYTRKITQ